MFPGDRRPAEPPGKPGPTNARALSQIVPNLKVERIKQAGALCA